MDEREGSELDLFGGAGAARSGEAPREGRGASGPAPEIQAGSPLAARMRPTTLEEFEGQEHLLGPGAPLRVMLEEDRLPSMILWGPPGSGKTTLARIVAGRTEAAFVPFSAVTEGVARVREIITQARERLRATGRRTVLFCDEIHRFNRAQQDAFLPHVEEGVVVLIGATTENPSFEVNRPLLSRAPVFILDALDEGEVARVLRRALHDPERGLGGLDLQVDDDALGAMARAADGDARRGLGILEAASALAGAGGTVDRGLVARAVQHRFAAYDKSGEEHYNLISALHKAVRGSDVDGALYWLARMLEGGEDALYIARRLVRMASEDVGLADPEALRHAVAARDAYHFLGSPEGDLALAQAAAYLATAPKSNRIFRAWGSARGAARETPAEPVPLHIRNAPTTLMKEWGYGEGYRYDHDEEHGVADQRYLPDILEGRHFYEPGPYGFERTIADRLRWWAERRMQATGGGGGEEEGPEVEGNPEPRDGVPSEGSSGTGDLGRPHENRPPNGPEGGE